MTDELQHFLLVVAHGSFTVAARHAHLAQPSLSASIARLEEAMGARILERLPRGARPTAAGEALIPHARATLAGLEAGRRAVAEIEGLRAGSVTVGGGATACTYLLPPILTAFRASHPGIVLRVREILSPDVGLAVAEGELDLGIAEDAGEPWLDDDLILVGAPGLSLPAPFVTFVRGASLRARLERSFPEAEIAMELGSIASVKGLVRAGMGLSLLSRVACRDDLQHGALVEIPDPRTPLRRRLGLVHAGIDRLSPAARALRLAILGDNSPIKNGDDLSPEAARRSARWSQARS